MQKILNLTQHVATHEQLEAGVFEPSEEDKKEIQKLLTFEEIPDTKELGTRAYCIGRIAIQYFDDFDDGASSGNAMIGGAPYFMNFLEDALKYEGIKPMYAFSKRESVDQVQPDGSVKKVAVFKHCGFVEV